MTEKTQRNDIRQAASEPPARENILLNWIITVLALAALGGAAVLLKDLL